MLKPLLVTEIETVTCCASESVKVAVQVPGFTPVTVTFQSGPAPLAAEKVAIGEPPPQLLACVNVPV
jgi:hypothetical protein